jgi:rhodanese-related sulfurtransferase
MIGQSSLLSGLLRWTASTLIVASLCAIDGHAQSPTGALFEPTEISARDLARRLGSSPRKLVVLDVRSEAEYRVSRLEGARRVDPAVAPGLMVRRFGRALGGNSVVFYCTTSRRSMDLALKSLDELASAGVQNVFVLQGGIIAWANQRRALVDRHGRRTVLVHTFDATIARSLRSPAQPTY